MRYESGEEVEADMKLVFENAMTYNPPAHPIHMQVSHPIHHPIHMQVSLLSRARREWAMRSTGGEHGGCVGTLSLAHVHCTLLLHLEH
jgi:hypothetical protein